MTTFTTKPMQHPLARLLAFSLGLAIGSIAQAADIPDIPLQANVSTDPNVMMILDDSGSMRFEIMPDDYTLTAWQQVCTDQRWWGCNNWGWLGGTAYYVFPRADNVYGTGDYTNAVVTVNWADPYARLARSPQINSVYYNPAITYTPWSRSDGSLFPNASTTCALHNPMNTGTGNAFCRNLTTNNSNYNNTVWIGCTSATNCVPDVSTRTFWPATYFRYNGGNIWNTGSYTQVTIQPSTTSYGGEERIGRRDCNSGVCTYDQEIQNFANWYTYYRSRVLTARAGIGRAFSAQGTGLRVGFAAINQSVANVDGFSSPSSGRTTLIRGVRQFSGNDRINFFSSRRPPGIE